MLLREKTQRRLCRVVFVVGCVLPTLAVGGVVTSRITGSHEHATLAAVGELLGADVRCEAFRTPRPGLIELESVELLSARSGASGDEPFAFCDRLRASHDGNVWRLRLGALVVPNNAFAYRSISDLVAETGSVDAHIDSLRLVDDARNEMKLDAVEARIRRDSDSSTLRASARGDERLALRTGGDHSECRVTTGDMGVPLAWLIGSLPSGIDAANWAFRGEWTRTAGPAGATGSAIGSLEASDAATRTLEAKRCFVRIDDAAWTADRLTRFVGRVELRDGVLARELVEGLIAEADAEPFPLMAAWLDHPERYSHFRFTQAAAQLAIDGDGITVVAGCDELDGHPRGGPLAHSVLTFQGEPLLREPVTRPLAPAQAVRALWHDRRVELPADASAIDLAGWLPRPATQR